MNALLAGGIVLAMFLSLFLIPLGLPGVWIVVLGALVLAWLGHLPWMVGYVAVVVAFVAELAEFVVLKKMGERYGGSRKAFWGAVIGGMAGLFVGVPVPVIGPLIVAFVGTFAGALLVTWWETRSLDRSTRVGWGVLLARVVSIGLKVAVGLALVVAVAAALLL